MRFSVPLLATWFATVGLTLSAFGQDPPTADLSVGLVDIQQIFRDHAPFAEQIDAHQTEAEAAQKQIARKEAAFQQVVEQLRSMKQDSKEFGELQRKAQKMAEELQATTPKVREAFAKRELDLNVEFHKAIRAAIEKVARERKIKIVLNRTKRSLDSEDPKEQLTAINQQVLYEEGVDITPDVLKILDAQAASGEGKKAGNKKATGDEKKADEKKGDEKKADDAKSSDKGKKSKSNLIELDTK